MAKKGGLPVFLAVTFGFSWGLWALMILSQRDLLPFRVTTNWSGSFGPSLGAIAAVAWSEGRPGLRALGRRLLMWRAGIGAWLVALFGVVLADGVALALFGAMSGRVPELEAFSSWGELLLYIPIILVVGGPLGEEVGWRGFLQPRLDSRMAPFWAAGLVGLVWVAWHVPLVWLEGAAQKGQSILAFALAVIPMAYIFAWVLWRSAGSLLLPLVLHTSINAVSYVVEPVVFGPLKGDSLLPNCFIAVLWAAALVLVLSSHGHFFKRPASQEPGGSDRSLTDLG